MNVTNAQIAGLLRRYAALLSVENADPFKLKAYRRAAETIESLSDNLARRIAAGDDPTQLPGIGNAIGAMIAEIVATGSLPRLDERLAHLPSPQAELTTRPRLDPSKVARIYKKLGISSLAELRDRLDQRTIAAQFGAKMDLHVRHGLAEHPRRLQRTVAPIETQILSYLNARPGITRAALAGSARRRQETVGNLNFLVSGENARILEQLDRFGAVAAVDSRGDDVRVATLSSGDLVTLRYTPESSWGLAWIRETGSTAHLCELTQRAVARGLELCSDTLSRNGIDASDEPAVYAGLGLSWIEPELREGRGEIEAAAAGTLPSLVTLADIRGDLHLHTPASDGAHTIEELAADAFARGYEYIGISDHSQSLKIANGLSEPRLWEQIRSIDRLNAKNPGLRILKSAEVDILEDGALDYSDAILRELDYTICSVHSKFGLDRERQTERILRAMDHSQFTILGHATGRLLLRRPGYEIDFERIVEHAAACGCFFEINANPNRLDLSDEHAKRAKEAGVRIAVNTDAHSLSELDYMTCGIDQARRGWLEAADVINAAPLAQLLADFRLQ